MSFEEDLGAALVKACELDSDSDVVHLARAVQIVRRHMFGETKPFTGFNEGFQEKYVPPLLLALVSMILEGASIKEQMADTNPAAIATEVQQRQTQANNWHHIIHHCQAVLHRRSHFQDTYG